MSYDGKILRKALNRLEAKRAERALLLAERYEEVCRQIPRIREIDAELKTAIIDIISASLRSGSNPVPAINVLRDKNLDLQAERAELLVSRGYPMDYLDDSPMCPLCGDTGYVGAEVCLCLKSLYTEEQMKELSKLLNVGSQSFDSFRSDYYSDEAAPGDDASPRENIDIVYETCVNYAHHFGKKSGNLFLSGPPGLGKTFLSACIARDVSQRGFSVVYDTAPGILAQFETQKFARDPEEAGAARDEVYRYLNCDLLIVDDLGTELTTPLALSSLYTLVNTRLVTGKKTVINSNLTSEELGKRYSTQILSRIEGEYIKLPFFGKDIRLLRKTGLLP
ncbi:ATP-binding protein [Papillibacter cinnamivorans]|uniref:DNA replication protein DnaC n=1 Tax=Papillibacter cinnamivorans DSM 12816 TaxID=1122930 RepID=A0A1W2A8H2_9FIRM|nr:ATP-binding protein [Papillibacter cinnamivorans]SMC56936.1 DNA replication protein DnaC [Papillibacter cinnamivorans DSM 12816]